MATDDEIIRKRLLIDGDGGSDDRRISSLLKTFVKWCNSSETPEESHATHQRMLAQLSQCELAMEKSILVHNMNLQEQQNYEEQNSKIESSIKDALEKINRCKSELQTAKKIRKNRQQYDVLAKVIQEHPDRQGTMRQLEALDKELEGLKDSKETLEHKLDMRRKQFHVLITAIQEMQRILEVDDKDDKEDDKTDQGTSSMDTT